MSPPFRVLVILASLFLVTITLELVRRCKLREEYSLFFLAGSGIALLLAIFAETFDRLATRLGIGPGLSLALGMAIFGLTIIQVSQGVIISSLAVHNRDLAQKVAQLEWQICQLCDGSGQRSAFSGQPSGGLGPSGLGPSGLGPSGLGDTEREDAGPHRTRDTESGAYMGEGPGCGL